MALNVRIALMARAPVPGQAKTRLIPALGAEGAARLAARMLDHAVAQAVAAGLGPVELWTTPDTTHPAFTVAATRHGALLHAQRDGDLGARMARVFATGFTTADTPLLLIGTDIPGLDAAALRAAAQALRTHAVVFAPTLDGGYALVGLRAAPPALLSALFDGMRWSTPQVMADTRQRLAALRLPHAELACVADIDVGDDLRHLPPTWPERSAQR